MSDVAVVIVTRDRREIMLSTLARLTALDERPSVLVVDNGSRDGTAAAVRERFPQVGLLALTSDRGAAARNAGLRAVAAPYVAFCDDDSWWAPGALSRAAAALDRAPRVAVLAARVLVGRRETLDPVCALMARSPLPADAGLPGPRVLGFVACGAVVRRDAVLTVGGLRSTSPAQAGRWPTHPMSSPTIIPPRRGPGAGGARGRRATTSGPRGCIVRCRSPPVARRRSCSEPEVWLP
jgi:GT2 family glycosyltransferase